MPEESVRPQQDEARQGLSDEELQAEQAQTLPDRENTSLINANLAIPINAGLAANVLSDGSTAYADALQGDPITQGT